MTKLVAHARGNAIAYLALFVTLGGTSYAAVVLPAGSVGARQIHNHSITPVKFDRTTIGGSVRYWARIGASGQVVASRPRVRVVVWYSRSDRLFAGGTISWGKPIPSGCFSLATVESYPAPAYVSAVTVNGERWTGDAGSPCRVIAPAGRRCGHLSAAVTPGTCMAMDRSYRGSRRLILTQAATIAAVVVFAATLVCSPTARANESVTACGPYANHVFQHAAVFGISAAGTCPNPPDSGGGMEVLSNGNDIPAGTRAYWQATAPSGLAIVGASVPVVRLNRTA